MDEVEPGFLARLPQVRTRQACAQIQRGSAFRLRVDAASCGSHKDAGYANRRRRPAGCF